MNLLNLNFYFGNPDAGRLVTRLATFVVVQQEAQTMVEACGIPLGLIDWTGRMVDVWPRVVKVAAERGRLRDLVEQAASAVPEEPLFARLLEQDDLPAKMVGSGPNGALSSDRVGSLSDAWQTPRLWKTVPMIDRAPLRTQLKKMQDIDGQRALLVVGQRQTGKSHARRFLSYLSDMRVLPRVVIIDNSVRAGTPITVQELAQKIAWAVVGRDAPSFDLVAQPESVAYRFLDWLPAVIAQSDEPLWLVFDQFTPDKTTAPATQLIEDLTTMAADYKLGPLRIVICGYTGSAIPFAGAATDSISHPSPDEVKLFFKRMSTLLTGETSEDAAIEIMFNEFVAQGGPVEDRSIAELGPSALAFATRIFEAVEV